jgi:hypothetical protein
MTRGLADNEEISARHESSPVHVHDAAHSEDVERPEGSEGPEGPQPSLQVFRPPFDITHPRYDPTPSPAPLQEAVSPFPLILARLGVRLRVGGAGVYPSTLPPLPVTPTHLPPRRRPYRTAHTLTLPPQAAVPHTPSPAGDRLTAHALPPPQ